MSKLTAKVADVQNLTYPDPRGENTRDLAEQLADLPEDGKRYIAEELQARVPSNRISFKPEWPRGFSEKPCYFGHVRYLEQYDAYRDEMLGRMDVMHGEEVVEDE